MVVLLRILSWSIRIPDLPVASIQDADTLTCVVSEIGLLVNIQASNPNVTYVWSTMNGSILSGATTLTPTVNGAGTYSSLD